jgi:hypothetical protein
VQVVDVEDQRALRRHVRDELGDGLGDRVRVGLLAGEPADAVGRAGAAVAEQAEQQRDVEAALAVVGVPVRDAPQLRLGGRAVVVEPHAGGLADQVGEGTEAAALAVRGDPHGQDAGAALGGDRAHFAGEAGLAHAGFGGVDEHQGLAAVDDRFEPAVDAPDLGVATDERRGVAEAGARPGLVFEAQELVDVHRFALALEPHGGEAAPGGGVLGGAHRLLAGPDGADRGDRADAGSGVHRVADDRVLEVRLHAGDDEAGAQPNAKSDGKTTTGLGFEETAHPFLHGLSGANRALGVVFVRQRRAEDGHEAVAHELVHVPAELVHRGDALRQEAVGDGRDPLGVEALGPGREVGEVGEQHRDVPALRLRGGRLRGEGRTAVVAVARTGHGGHGAEWAGHSSTNAVGRVCCSPLLVGMGWFLRFTLARIRGLADRYLCAEAQIP